MLSAAVFLVLYFLTLDIALYGRAKNRGPFRYYKPGSNQPAQILSTNILDTIQNSNKINSSRLLKNLNSNVLLNFEDLKVSSISNDIQTSFSIFWPLPVKKIMIADATHFIRSPIAEFVEHSLKFSDLFPFITANSISLLHSVLSVLSIRFLSHDSLFWRQFGVCLFQFRNFLDSFDGVIYRALAKRTTYKSHYGSLGYFVDAFSDVFGGICLIGSIAIYLLKHPPPNKNLTRCFRIAEDPEDPLSTNSNTFTSKNELSNSQKKESYYLPQSNIITSNNKSITEDDNHSYIYNQLNNINKDEKEIVHYKEINSNFHATKAAVLCSVALLGIRLGLSALFWDRSVHTYEDLIDSVPKSELHQVNLNKKLNHFLSIDLIIDFPFLES